MKGGLIESLQMNRYRLLYYFVSVGKVKDEPGLNSRLMKAFGYKSPGHFYPDLEFLFNDGLLEKTEDGFIRSTDKADSEFSFISYSENATKLTMGIGIVMAVYSGGIIFGIAEPVWPLLGASVMMVIFGFFNRRAILRFIPSIPPDEAFEDSKT